MNSIAKCEQIMIFNVPPLSIIQSTPVPPVSSRQTSNNETLALVKSKIFSAKKYWVFYEIVRKKSRCGHSYTWNKRSNSISHHLIVTYFWLETFQKQFFFFIMCCGYNLGSPALCKLNGHDSCTLKKD